MNAQGKIEVTKSNSVRSGHCNACKRDDVHSVFVLEIGNNAIAVCRPCKAELELKLKLNR